MRKKISAYTTPTYKSGYRSYIELKAPTRLLPSERFRLSFDLNRIPNLAKRKGRADEICNLLKVWLEAGKYLEDFNEVKARQILIKNLGRDNQKFKKRKKKFSQLPFKEGFALALKYACHDRSGNTIRTRESVAKLFVKWMEENKLTQLKISEVKDKHARFYLDNLDYEQGVAWRTWNNKKRELRIIFTELKKRKLIKKNPFRTEKFSDKKGTGLMHEILPFEEAKIVIEYLHKNDKYLFYFILIEFFGFARPSEIRKRLKRYHFRLNNKTIEVPGVVKTKTETTKWLTIPDEFLPYFFEPWFERIPRHHYIFGAENRPNTSPAGEHSIYNRYRRLIKKMHSQGIINKPYTQIYDWKRRGITEFLKLLPPTIVRDQAGHRRVESTLVYHHPENFSHEMSNSKTNLM